MEKINYQVACTLVGTMTNDEIVRLIAQCKVELDRRKVPLKERVSEPQPCGECE